MADTQHPQRSRAAPIIILLKGDPHSGKTTTGEMIADLAERAGLHAVVCGYADRLKVVAQHLIQLFHGITIPLAEFHDAEKKNEVRPDMPLFNGRPFTLRAVCQQLGSEIFRNHFWGDIWCDVIYRTYVCVPAPPDIIVIADYRFPNEREYWRRASADARHNCAGLECRAYCILRENRAKLAADAAAHQSEAHVATLPVDAELDNNGSFADLRATVAATFGPIIARAVAARTIGLSI